MCVSEAVKWLGAEGKGQAATVLIPCNLVKTSASILASADVAIETSAYRTSVLNLELVVFY